MKWLQKMTFSLSMTRYLNHSRIFERPIFGRPIHPFWSPRVSMMNCRWQSLQHQFLIVNIGPGGVFAVKSKENSEPHEAPNWFEDLIKVISTPSRNLAMRRTPWYQTLIKCDWMYSYWTSYLITSGIMAWLIRVTWQVVIQYLKGSSLSGLVPSFVTNRSGWKKLAPHRRQQSAGEPRPKAPLWRLTSFEID